MSYNNYQRDAARYFSGELMNVGGERGRVWKTTFHQRNQNPPSDRVIYYDDIAIGNSFIGLVGARDLDGTSREPVKPTTER